MLLYLIKSILIGLIFGLLYGFLFITKSKKLYYEAQKANFDTQSKKDSSKKKIKVIFAHTCLHLLNHTLLIALLLFLIIKFEFNIPLVIISLMFSFWTYILKAKK